MWKPGRNIQKKNVIKDNITTFLTTLSAYAKKPKMAIEFHDLFHDLLNCSEYPISTIKNAKPYYLFKSCLM